MQHDVFTTAGDHFRSGSGDVFWSSLAVAVFLQVMMVRFTPEPIVVETASDRTAYEIIDLEISVSDFEIAERPVEPAEVEPEPPRASKPRPSAPILGKLLPGVPDLGSIDAAGEAIAETVASAPITFAGPPIEGLIPAISPPGGDAGEEDISAAPRFTPMTVRPELMNRAQIQRLLVRRYPAVLRESGIGGSPTVHFFIDTDGTVLKTQLAKSSGHRALDEAALSVAGDMKFTPAVNNGRLVQVWVEIPIVFRTN